jgi:tRNA pseudouridine38-40 synthase
MSRYFIEVAYRGSRYSGFQVQENAATIQSEVEKAYMVLHRRRVLLTGSSRTDAGVHALQNYFHFDSEEPVHEAFVYKMNAILPADLVVRSLRSVPDTAHARFDAVSREYQYRVHRFKNPFLEGTSFFYPYTLDLEAMKQATDWLRGQTDFRAFSKTNSGAKTTLCRLYYAGWTEGEEQLLFRIEANRFLRGMVRLITATLLKIGRGKVSQGELEALFGEKGKAIYAVPAHGLFLKSVNYPENYFSAMGGSFTGF